jgi:tRNA modification GTPase
LLGYERAIVSEIHGTTRDTIEEVVNLGGVAVRLRDTAGIRETTDRLEREAVARTHHALQSADVRILVLDANAPRSNDLNIGGRRSVVSSDHLGDDGALPSSDPLLVLNKSDLEEHGDWQSVSAIRISCVTGAGFEELEQAILRHIGMENLQSESAFAVNARHADCLCRACEALDRATTNLREGTAGEIVAFEVRDALRAIEEVIGVSDDEAVRDAIFAQFCIGK